MPEPLMSIKNLSAHYQTPRGEKIFAVNDVSFDLYPGEIIGLAGESGCGKSTLIQAAMGLFFSPLKYSSGEIIFDHRNILSLSDKDRRESYLGKQLSIIPQSALNSLNPTQKIGSLAFHIARSHLPGVSRKEILSIMADRLEDMGLKKKVLNMYPMELSGGMKQRAVIALSTILNPKVIIADEPTSALDVSSQKEIIELIMKLMDRSLISGMIFITHELALLKHIATKIAVMYAGQIVEFGETDKVIDHPAHPYSRALLDSMLLPDGERLNSLPVPLKGVPPSLMQVPNQCLFADRCTLVQEGCLSYKQTLKYINRRQVRCEYA